MIRVSIRTPRPTRQRPRLEAERGQLLVIFALALVALIGMVGLIIDGGDTALQRRDQQNVADAAAMAAGYAFLNYEDEFAAAQAVAAANGYTHGQDSTTVVVTSHATGITVEVSRPHRNYFSGILGFSSWDVTTTATVESGVPNAATGTMPIIFNEDAFDNPANRDPNAPATFSEPPPGTEDIPLTDAEFNWTVFCTAGSDTCNANSDVVEDWVEEDGIQAEVTTDWMIAPLNAGSHTTLFSAMAGVVGESFPVAIVDDDGVLLGWGYFHLEGAVGGSSKSISGWFEEAFDYPELGTVHGRGTAGTFGGYVVQLID